MNYFSTYSSFTQDVVMSVTVWTCCVIAAGFWMCTPACCLGGEVQHPSFTLFSMVTKWQESPSSRSALTGKSSEKPLCFFLTTNTSKWNTSLHPRFDVGPILNQELHQVPEKCTADELGAVLAIKGAHLVSCRIMGFKKVIKAHDDNVVAVFVFLIAACWHVEDTYWQIAT